MQGWNVHDQPGSFHGVNSAQYLLHPQRTQPAVRGAEYEQRRLAAVIHRAIARHDKSKNLGVLPIAEILFLGLAGHHPAIPGFNGIDEQHVRLVKPGMRIVDHLVWRTFHKSLVAGQHQLGSGQTHVRVNRARSRSAAKRDRKRSLVRVGAVQDNRLDEYLGFDLFIRADDGHRAARHRIVEAHTVQRYLVRRGDKIIPGLLFASRAGHRIRRGGAHPVGGGGRDPSGRFVVTVSRIASDRRFRHRRTTCRNLPDLRH